MLQRIIPTLSRGTGAISATRLLSNAQEKDIRQRLLETVKTAMKKKDTTTATTIRSVLSEVYAKEKTTGTELPASTILSILRKAATRRMDAAKQFNQAQRQDLAEKETREAKILDEFLPKLMGDADVEKVIRELITEHQASTTATEPSLAQNISKFYKGFYSRVDKSSVDADTVKRIAQKVVAEKA